MPSALFWGCLAFRLVNALVVRTAFVPDEYWQSVEVAHRLAFGRGHLTWEWAAGLRGYAHPAAFAALFWALARLRLDSAWAVARAPALLQAAAAAAADVHVHRLAARVAGPSAAAAALACQLASWFNFYCLTRTLANSAEAALVVVGAYHWVLAEEVPLGPAGRQPAAKGGAGASRAARRQRRRHRLAWLAAAAACAVLRPPSMLFWGAVAAASLAARPGAAAAATLAAEGAAVGAAALGVAAAVDRWGYGRWVLVPWHFLRFNLLQGGSRLYGAHAWHWNATQGFPAVLASLAPLLAAGLWRARPAAARLAWLVAAQLAAYSLAAHKEFRFLLPALQLAAPLCGAGLARLLHARGAGRAAALACVALQLPMALYFGAVHGRGQVAVLGDVRALAAAAAAAGRAPASVLFLTPCHATPYFSHLHGARVRLRFLDCSPPGWAAATAALNAGEAAWLRLPPLCAGAGATERRCFEAAPARYVEQVLALNRGALPSAVVAYSPAADAVGGALAARGYARRRRLTNCWVQTDDDAPCGLELWVRGGE